MQLILLSAIKYNVESWITHSSVLAWRIPGTGEPGGLPSMGSQSQTRLKRLSSSSSRVLNKVWKQIMDTNIKFCEMWTKSVLQLIMLNHVNFFFFFNFYNVVLVSAVQQCKSGIVTHTSLPSLTPSPAPIRSLQAITEHHTGLPVLHAASHQLSTSHPRVHTCWCYFLHSSLSLPPPLSTSPFCVYICISFPSLQVSSSVSLFLDSIYMC